MLLNAQKLSAFVPSQSGLTFYELGERTWIDSTKYGWYYPDGATKTNFIKPTILIGEIIVTYKYDSVQYDFSVHQRW